MADQQFVFLGAGSSTGVADYLRAAMVAEGLPDAEARRRFWIVDIAGLAGLLHTGRTDLTPDQRAYAQPTEATANWTRSSNGKIGLADVISHRPIDGRPRVQIRAPLHASGLNQVEIYSDAFVPSQWVEARLAWLSGTA